MRQFWERSITMSFIANLSTKVISIVLALIAIYLGYGGIQLIGLGGSFYYVIAALFLLVSAFYLFKHQIKGAYAFFIFLALTVIWAIWEAGFDFWPFIARVGLFAFIGIFVALVMPSLKGTEQCKHVKSASYTVSIVLLLVVVGAFINAFNPIWLVKPDQNVKLSENTVTDDQANWTNYGRTPDGQQFSPAKQITPENVKDLKVAWTFRTGDFSFGGAENQNTPLQIGDKIYACTPQNDIFAIDANTGKQIWKFDPNVNAGYSPTWQRCRSLAYYELPAPVSGDQGGQCHARIYETTADLRLIAVDAATGKPCEGFGDKGNVSLATGMGELVPGFYNPTAGPVLAKDKLIVGGWIMDNQGTDEPSGVVRAFDAVSGKLVWAWDVGRPGIHTEPKEGETYTRSTPNTWAVPTYDSQTNTVYLATGNGTPDLFGGNRTPETDRVSSSIVALDANTGDEKWVFQTTHHDVWDYDLPSKPVLVEMQDKEGKDVPALIQTSKRGEIWVLNRITGKPLTDVVEKNVPTDAVAGDKLSPTQPYSVGMPQIRQGVLTEKTMWGITPLDQLSCRIAFKQLKYEGDFTPPSTSWYIPHPSPFGTMNWGGISIDAVHNLMIVNDMRIMMKAKLIPRDQFNQQLANSGKAGPSVGGLIPLDGTPYGANRAMVTSPLGVPCTDPPFGAMTAIDLKTHKIVWQRSLGTPERLAPIAIARLPVPLGMPSLGGPVATASGLIFYTGTADYYLRAMDVVNGNEIWKTPLPVGAQSTPLVFTSPSSGKQYVVVTAGGGRTAPDRGDYIIAYALDDK